MRKITIFIKNYFFYLLLLLGTVSCSKFDNDQLVINGLTMGTTYSISYFPRESSIGSGQLESTVSRILNTVNQQMSTYINDSELSILNQSQSTDWQTVSEPLYEVIEHADSVSQLTNGAFDVTVGPLVNLWGFGPDPQAMAIPTIGEIMQVRAHTGSHKLAFNPETKQLKKSDPDIYIDLSAIAKGYAVDVIALYLDELGLNNYLVEIGGELIGKGKNANQQPWQIGIEQAQSLTRAVQRIVSLNNIAMATSGDYRNYFEKDGVRYSHTIDPASGEPIRHQLVSVSVLDERAMHADAMATAFTVLGEKLTMELADELTLPVYLIIKTDTGFKEHYNRYFAPYLSE